ncbi:hypothetical protein IKF88_00615 [Candidatus Saccharibacteria bacterium]|nr:hypothetical protein [Candidatus Saccharibacteria bacterium]
MAENLPEPKSRKESYLAKAAGMDVTVPEAPESREEQYLAAIAEGGGGGGSDINVVQTTGTSTTDVMSQDATTKLIYPDIANSHKITIGASVSASSNQSNAVSINANVGSNCDSSVAIAGASNNKAAIGTFGNAYGGIAIGHANVFQGSYGVAIGDNATSYYKGSGESGNVAIGSHAQASDSGNTKSSVALGYYSLTNRTGEVNVGGLYGNGYNGTDYRVIGGVHDPVDAHDAATKGYVDAQAGGGDTVYSTKTTSNSATGGAVYIGNLGTDQAEVADPSPNDNHYKYFWALPSSNNGATYGFPGDGTVNIMGSARGAGSVTIGRNAGSGSYGAITMVAIGDGANSGNDGVSIGSGAGTSQDFTGNVCVGAGATITDFGVTNSISLGRYSKATRAGELNIGTSLSHPDEGFNSSAYRVIGGVYDGQELHDAATVAQGNTLSTSAPTTSTEGVLGQLWTDTTNMHTYQCTAISGSTYTWTQRW